MRDDRNDCTAGYQVHWQQTYQVQLVLFNFYKPKIKIKWENNMQQAVYFHLLDFLPWECKKWQIEEDLGNTTESDIMLIPDIYLTHVSHVERKKMQKVESQIL